MGNALANLIGPLEGTKKHVHMDEDPIVRASTITFEYKEAQSIRHEAQGSIRGENDAQPTAWIPSPHNHF